MPSPWRAPSFRRLGSASDIDEASRQQIVADVAIAENEQGEAEEQLDVDQLMVATNCDVIGPNCKAAMDAEVATEAKLAVARCVLKRQGVVVDDSMAKRLTAWFPFLTKEQVQLYQPMLLPMGLAFFGSLMIAIGEAGGCKQAPTVTQELAKRAGPKEHEEPELNTAPALPQLVVAVPKALTEILKPVQGKCVEIADALIIASEGEASLSFICDILRQYHGDVATHPVCQAMVDCLPENDVRLQQVRDLLRGTGIVRGAFGMTEAYQRKVAEIEPWQSDARPKVRDFALAYMKSMQQSIAAEHSRSEQDVAMRKLEWGKDLDDDRA